MSLDAAILDLLFPPKCPFCARILDEPRAPVCPQCQQDLPWLNGPEAERRVEFAQSCFSPLAYRGRVPDAVHRYKFRRVRSCAVPLGCLMAQCLEEHLEDGAHLITWAPLSRRRLRERGFDQAELLARTVGKERNIPAAPTLRKVRHTDPQSSLSEDSQRRANALGAYELLPGVSLAGKRVVLVDDVVTSGSTLGECARLLCQAGAEQVFCLTLAQAKSGDPPQKEREEREKQGRL